MVLSTNAMSRKHNLDAKEINIAPAGKQLDRLKSWKMLGLTIDQHFELKEHINKIIKESYATLRTLKKLKRYTSFFTRKQLGESLILSKLDYCNALFHHLPSYTISQM